jgi:uncharacterized protein YegL
LNILNSPSDPPPAYTPGPVGAISARGPSTASDADDRYAFLKTFDTVFLIDDSGSMAGGRWTQAQNALRTVTPVCVEHDANGVDIHFLNASESYEGVTDVTTVLEIFTTVRPRGGTPTGQRLYTILKTYLKRYEKYPNTTKPINIIVITDGEPSDDVESPIIEAAKKLDKLDAVPWQVGIQFFQIGRDPAAREHLKQLDDNISELAGEDIRDIVDTVPFEGEGNGELTKDGILKVVLGSVNRRLDRRSKELHRAR